MRFIAGRIQYNRHYKVQGVGLHSPISYHELSNHGSNIVRKKCPFNGNVTDNQYSITYPPVPKVLQHRHTH